MSGALLLQSDGYLLLVRSTRVAGILQQVFWVLRHTQPTGSLLIDSGHIFLAQWRNGELKAIAFSVFYTFKM